MTPSVSRVEELTRRRELSPKALMRIATQAGVTTHALLEAIAISIGRRYLKGQMTYCDASMLMNRIMPEVGFEQAPLGFWKVYLALEDAEGRDDPDPIAQPLVEAALADLESS